MSSILLQQVSAFSLFADILSWSKLPLSWCSYHKREACQNLRRSVNVHYASDTGSVLTRIIKLSDFNDSKYRFLGIAFIRVSEKCEEEELVHKMKLPRKIPDHL
jgi:hypothetical protein